jgi:hypothetical protein
MKALVPIGLSFVNLHEVQMMQKLHLVAGSICDAPKRVKPAKRALSRIPDASNLLS